MAEDQAESRHRKDDAEHGPVRRLDRPLLVVEGLAECRFGGAFDGGQIEGAGLGKEEDDRREGGIGHEDLPKRTGESGRIVARNARRASATRKGRSFGAGC